MTTAGNGSSASTGDDGLPRDAYALLAQANLLRTKGCWDDAVQNCMAALRIVPDNASAHSLLGDIYENQGRTDDAVQWYRMALDVNPDSPADQIKLERLLALGRERIQTRDSDTNIRLRLGRSPIQTPPITANPERLLRAVAWLAAGLFLLVVVLAGTVMHTHSFGSGPVTVPPVVVTAPLAAPLPTPGTAVPSDPTSTATGGSAQTAPSPPVSDEDAAEQALIQALKQDSRLAALGIVPVGAEIDPRTNTAVVTVTCPSPPAQGSVRQAVLVNAAETALACVRADGGSVTAWTIRCMEPVPGTAAGAVEMVLVADTTSSALSALGADPSTLTMPQLAPAFQNVWWSPAATN